MVNVTDCEAHNFEYIYIKNCGYIAQQVSEPSCLHRASKIIKHFIIQLMHNI